MFFFCFDHILTSYTKKINTVHIITNIMYKSVNEQLNSELKFLKKYKKHCPYLTRRYCSCLQVVRSRVRFLSGADFLRVIHGRNSRLSFFSLHVRDDKTLAVIIFPLSKHHIKENKTCYTYLWGDRK